MWVIAQQLGLAVQPISPVFLYAHDQEDLEKLSPVYAQALQRLQDEFRELIATAPGESQALVLRFADAPATSVRSRRRAARSQYASCITADPGANVARTLDEVVTAVATELMAVNAATSAAVSQRVLADLVSHFGVDVSFLRHNDHNIRATRLVAEWPVRPDIPDPDPLGVVYFDDADPVFALCEHQKEPVVFRPEPSTDDYQRTIEEGRNIPATSMSCVPLLSGDVTTGVLGFVKFGDREWTPEELNALEGDRIAVRPAAGAHRGRGSAALSRRARRPDRAEQPSRPAGTPRPSVGSRPTRAGLGAVPRPGPAQGDQRLSGPHGGRLVHPGVRRDGSAKEQKAPT